MAMKSRKRQSLGNDRGKSKVTRKSTLVDDDDKDLFGLHQTYNSDYDNLNEEFLVNEDDEWNE
ncbi:hypothetical protein Pyn_18269 [Prunus yedoensis var. nudiflora]|uniref:Uncharacterized protein n=1 Tax=Prunus yedoensis var. nudiflora TaxID=2094558 RepID=A0A314YHG9_PRUYE|nr:hypothetical protein Pyn_18269 [Prunus yedoensis var. nudiflora]